MIEPIELTEKHKEMLIEMSSRLFPAYDFGFENDYAEDGIMEYYEDPRNWKFIHWFEFCLMVLQPKLNDIDELECTYFQDYVEAPQLIDFLYKKFKLINNDNKKEKK